MPQHFRRSARALHQSACHFQGDLQARTESWHDAFLPLLPRCFLDGAGRNPVCPGRKRFSGDHPGRRTAAALPKARHGHLSIGVSATLCKYVLLPILQPFIRQNPHIQLSIACQSSLETMQALEQGTLDIGLIGAEDDMSAFVFEPLTDIQDIFVTTHTYLDNLKERIRQNDHLSSRTAFAASTLLLLNKENITRRYIDRYLSRKT